MAIPNLTIQNGNWTALRNFLARVKEIVEQLAGDPTRPNIVFLGADIHTAGVCLKWEHTNRADHYLVWRSPSVAIASAYLIATLDDALLIHHLDVFGQAAIGSTRTYWVQAINKMGLSGPLSNPFNTTDLGL